MPTPNVLHFAGLIVGTEIVELVLRITEIVEHVVDGEGGPVSVFECDVQGILRTGLARG